MNEIAEWLRSLGFDGLVPLFVDNGIDEAVLATLTEQDLRELGVTRFGDRRKLAMAIAELNKMPAVAETTNIQNFNRPQPAVEATARSVAERRHLTVMFCDLVGSTALAARLDPEDMRELVRAYQGACAQVIGRYEGFVAQYLGDGIMAYFGYPAAHEDDAERAVRAGLDLIAAVAKLDTRAKVEVRVGIATGLVVVGDLIGEHAAKERAVTGETPNLAARLQGLAAPNSIVLSAATRRLLGGMFDLCDLGAQQVKGLNGPVQAFAVGGVRSFESRFEARAGGLTGFVGREEEREHLLDRWKLARQGRGQVVLVSGEAGIGKSRLTAWLVDRVFGDPHIRMRYQCTPHHKDSALYPTIAQIERAAGIETAEPGRDKLPKLKALLALADGKAAETVPLYAALLAIPVGDAYPPLEMSPGQQRQRTLAALLDQVEALARQKPLLMIYEDAHWADATSLELLGSLVDRLARLPALLVVTGRPEFSPAWMGRHNVSTTMLQKLDKRHTREMVESVTGGADLPAEMLEQIIAKTDGVPLFVEELTKTVLESGALADHSADMKQVTALPVPATLKDSLMARLDRSNPVKEIAQIGAAIGREFSYGLLLAVAGMDELSVQSALSQLEQSELAFRRGLPPDAIYTFKHALVQDAAYESLLRSRRQRLHRRIAKALRDRFPVLAETEPEIIAHHFTQAARGGQAVGWWTRAGELALQRSAYTEATNHFIRAIRAAAGHEADPALWPVLLRLWLAHANSLIVVRGYGADETTAAFEKCCALAIKMENAEVLCAARYGVWVGSFVLGDVPRAIDLAEAFAAETACMTGPAVFFRQAMLGASYLIAGDYDRTNDAYAAFFSSREARSDLPAALRVTHDLMSALMIFYSMSSWIQGAFERSKHYCDAAVARARQTGKINPKALILRYKCSLDFMRDDARSVLREAENLREVGLQHDLSAWVVYASVFAAWARSRDGERSSIEPARRALEGSTTIQERGFQGLLFNVILADCSDTPQEATKLFKVILEVNSQTKLHWFDAELYRRLGASFLRCAPPNSDRAEKAFLSALAVARRHRARAFELRASLDLASLYRDTGREHEAVPLLQGALVGFTETPELPEIGKAQQLLASLGGEMPACPTA